LARFKNRLTHLQQQKTEIAHKSLALAPQSNSTREASTQENIDLIKQLVLNSRAVDGSVYLTKDNDNDNDNDKSPNHINLDVSTSLDVGGKREARMLQITIHEELGMVIHPFNNLPPLHIQQNQQTSPNLARLLKAIQEAIPTDELSPRQKSLFDSFFQGNLK